MTIQTIINKVRPKIGDTSARKFTNDRLVELINEGLDDLGRNAWVKKKNMTLPIVPFTKVVTIPDINFLKVNRIRIEQQNVPLYTHREMDKLYNKWEYKTGEKILAIVYDLLSPRELKLYPLLEEASTDYEAINNNTEGTLLVDIPNVPNDSLYGLITSVDLEDYVNPENIYDEDEIENLQPILSLSDTFITMELNYYAIPDLIVTDSYVVTDEVDLPDSYLTTLVYYVAGTALLDDNRNENIQKGSLLLNKYAKELKENKGRVSSNHQTVKSEELPYRTGF